VDVTRGLALRRGVLLEQVTVVWMLAEAVLALGAGIAARSVLLTAFGVDSIVELLSGAVLLRRLSLEAGGAPVEGVERLEKRTEQISAILLVVLCAYVVLTSAAGLLLSVKPEGSALGLVVSAAAVIGMPVLAYAKSRANRTIGSASLRADIAESVTCAYMAAVTLAGLAASMLFGVWWIQYIAALGLLVWLVPETREAIEAAKHSD
jgi:divalent metal cation (Fe/Co/Zn/Cd) transporter